MNIQWDDNCSILLVLIGLIIQALVSCYDSPLINREESNTNDIRGCNKSVITDYVCEEHSRYGETTN